jgi:hypothetical protein
MTDKELIAVIRKDVADAAAKGQAGISLVDLDRYLASLEQSIPQSPPTTNETKLVELQHQSAIAQFRAYFESGIEMFKSVIASGQNALKSSAWINGGAAAALLAFIGHLATEPKTTNLVSNFAMPLSFFVAGALATSIASGLTYLAQFCFARNNLKCGNVVNVLAILLIIGAYFFFAWGCRGAYKAFLFISSLKGP